VISTEHIARRIGTLSSEEHTTVQEALLKLSKISSKFSPQTNND